MFDWMATAALKTFFERMTILTKSTFLGALFFYSYDLIRLNKASTSDDGVADLR